MFRKLQQAAFASSLFWIATIAIAQEAPSKPAPAKPMDVWLGKLETPTQSIRVRVELQKTKAGFRGVLVSPDQGNARLPVGDVVIADDKFRFELLRPKASYKGKLAEDGKSVEGMWSQGGREMPLNLRLKGDDFEEPVAQPKETWKGTLNAGVKLELQVRLLVDPDSQEEICYFDSLTQGVSALKSSMEKKDGKLIIDIPSIQGRFEGDLSEDGEKATGLWSQGPLKLPLELERTDDVAEAMEVNRPQHPVPPFPYIEEEVEFSSPADGVRLAGTLTMPKDPTGKLTVAILISGSGPQDRDETLMGHKPFLVIADHLTKQGIAVLRYDDRGTGGSTGDHSTATTPDFADDVQGAIAFLRTRKEIDPKAIGLIGHSEGGLIGPIVTAVDPDIAFLVMLAGPGVNGEKIILNQSEAISRAAGESEAAIELQKKQMPLMIAAIKEGADAEKIEAMTKEFASAVKVLADEEEESGESSMSAEDLESLIMTGYERMKSPWFRYFLTYEPVPALEKTKCPILSIIGEKDLQVDPKLNIEPLRTAISKAGHPKSVCRELPGLNHLFQECETGGLDEYQTIEQTFAPSALELMSDWIQSLE